VFGGFHHRFEKKTTKHQITDNWYTKRNTNQAHRPGKQNITHSPRKNKTWLKAVNSQTKRTAKVYRGVTERGTGRGASSPSKPNERVVLTNPTPKTTGKKGKTQKQTGSHDNTIFVFEKADGRHGSKRREANAAHEGGKGRMRERKQKKKT